MIPSLPRWGFARSVTAGYVAAFFAFLFVPLAVVAVFAFNDANYPAPPWRGFTLDWFVGSGGRVGLFGDRPLLKSIGTSAIVACWVTVLSVAIGTANAFLLERARFRGKTALSMLMLAPLVIPGVILGISILAFASRLAQFADDFLGAELDFLRPGLPLVVLGQFSYIVSIATLTIAARLKRLMRRWKKPHSIWGVRAGVLATITLPYLKPALIGSARDFVPDVVRELQHDADAGRLGFAADADHDVRQDARGRKPGSERSEPVSDDRLALLALLLLRRPGQRDVDSVPPGRPDG
jgi:spermidine/putrescine transport system permease protein